MKNMAVVEKTKLYDLCNEVETLRQKNKMLEDALYQLVSRTDTNPDTEVLVPRKTFVDIYERMVSEMVGVVDDPETTPIYNKDTFVSWNGIKCNCENGAQVANIIITAISDLDDEFDGYEWSSKDVEKCAMSDYIESEFSVD